MIFVSFLFFTVSTLVVHGRETSNDGPVIPKGCEGKTLCDIKPDDYPQKEIDRYLANNPEHLERMKRDVSSGYTMNPKLEDGSRDGNCKIKEAESITPYSHLKKKGVMPYVILQSKYLEQNFTQFRCENSANPAKATKGQCFQKYTNKLTKCVQKTAAIMLYVYDRQVGDVIPIQDSIDVDCVCEIDERPVSN